MVDTSTLAGVLRASQSPVSRRQPRPTPQPVPPTPSPNVFNRLVQSQANKYGNLGKAILGTGLGALDVPVQIIGGAHRDVAAGSTLGGQSPGSRALQNYGEQVGGLWSDVFKPGAGQTEMFLPRQFDAAGEAAVDRFGLEGAGASAVRGGATALDLLTGLMAGGVGVGGGRAGVAGDAVIDTATNPAAHARLNAMLGRLYHGVRGDDWTVAQNRPFENRAHNWFRGDLFTTPSLPLADSYGGTTVKQVKNLPSNLKVLDLMPGGPSITKQNSELAKKFAELGIVDTVNDLQRHLPFTSLKDDLLKEVLESQGFNALRHVSGQGMGGGTGLAKPVYAFFSPEGITTSPVSSLNRATYKAGEVLGDVPAAARRVAEKAGGRLVDTVDEVLRKTNSSNPKVQEFLSQRGKVVPASLSSSGQSYRITIDPTTGRTITIFYKPNPVISNVLESLGAPSRAIKSAQEASLNAYQKALNNYSSLEKANRKTFLESTSYGQQLFPSGTPVYGGLGGNLSAPMPPGYTPLTQPAQPGALDFLKYLFAQ